MFIDTHAHLNFNAFNEDREKIIKECLKNNIWMINVGTDYKTSKKAVETAGKYHQGVFAAVGFHPINLDTGLVKMRVDQSEGSEFEEKFDYEKYKELAKQKKVVAIGEIGLDFWRRPKSKKKREEFKKKQKELFLKELELAKELKLPVILHCRLALDDMIEILQMPVFHDLRGVIHCFTGNLEQAKKFLEMGFYIGFNGIIFKLDLDAVIKKTPMEKILTETDCPYLTPPDFGEERNNPFGIKYVIEKIADLKNLSLKEVEKTAFKNAKDLFKIS